MKLPQEMQRSKVNTFLSVTAGVSVTQHGCTVEKFLSSSVHVGGRSSNGGHDGHRVLTLVLQFTKVA